VSIKESLPSSIKESSPSSTDLDLVVNFVDFKKSPAVVPETATPLFWHIPKAGGTSAERLAYCLDLVVAKQRHPKIVAPPSLDVLNTPDGQKHRFVNVDPTTIQGIQDAKKLGFAEHLHLADFIKTPYLTEAADGLFNENHKGSLFVIFRHPVERAVSMFYYLQHADWESTYRPELANYTIEEYQSLPGVEKNWVVRFLVGKSGGELTQQDLSRAKSILAQKALVGFTDQMAESLRRFGIYFGWNNRHQWEACVRAITQNGSNAHQHPKVLRNSSAWEAIAKNNEYDIELYEYALKIFEEQGLVFV